MQKFATSYMLCVNKEFTFDDLKRINLDDYDTVVLLVKFLRWCQFDIRNEYEEYWNSHKDRARVEDIMRLRSSHSTLEKVGNIYGITRERIRQIEAKAVRQFRVWEKNYNYLAKMAAECGCCSVIPFKLIKELLSDDGEIIIYLLRLADKNNCRW